MALLSGTSRLKPLSLQNCHHSLVFKEYIFRFVNSLGKEDRSRFRFWCIDLIPRAKLDIDVASDGDMLKLVEFLLDDLQLSFTDMSLLKAFLSAVNRFDLLEILKKVELRIAIGIILKNYTSKDIAYHLYADVVEFLVSARGKNQELISQALEQLREAGDDSVVLSLLDGVIQECQLNPQLSWPEVTALFVIMGELYSSISSDSEVEEDFETTTELFAEWMLKLGGLKVFKKFIRKKENISSGACELSSNIEESLKKAIKFIGHQVDMESST